MSNEFNPNGLNEKLATVIERLDELKNSTREARDEARANFVAVHRRVDEQDRKIIDLQVEDTVRHRQTKFAVALGSSLAAFIGWITALWSNHPSK